MTDFVWPWQYNFPPFFTLQPNKDVRKIQLDAWCSLLIGWSKVKNLSQIDTAEASSLEVFRNASINRHLPIESIVVVLNELERRGNLEWIDKNKKRALLYWRSPAEWGEQIYSWAQTNNRINAVCTLYEISQSDEVSDQEFYQLNDAILLKAMRRLEIDGKAELMEIGDSRGLPNEYSRTSTLPIKIHPRGLIGSGSHSLACMATNPIYEKSLKEAVHYQMMFDFVPSLF